MSLASSIILILISIAIGFLIGALVFSLRRKPGPPAAGSESPHTQQGVRLWRDLQSQNLSVEVDGKIIERSADLTPETRSRLARLARDWQLWLGLPSSRLAALASPPGQVSVVEPQPPQAAPTPGSPVQPPGIKAPLKPSRGAEKGKAETAPQSIAAQIDAILQARIENGPLAKRGIKLQEIPGQGLVVLVGADKYTDLTLVPDQEVRDAIAAAVAEWENKNAPWG